MSNVRKHERDDLSCNHVTYDYKHEYSLRNLWGSIKKSYIHVIRIPKGEERENGEKPIFRKIMEEIGCKCQTFSHSSTLAWKIPGMEGPGGLQSMGSLRVGHN